MRFHLESLALVFSFCLADGCLVFLSTGPIEGRLFGTTCVYQGIPYAKPPIGSLRFQRPQKPANWNAPLQTKSWPPWCPQTFPEAKNQSEDCLYLNVFQPQGAGSMPVFVWIHGGGFVTGSGSRFPVQSVINQIASRGIVVVTINYRLNVFGFATTGTEELPANLGMLDQRAALLWVQTEINQFAGDPSRVTIAGESAGGASTSLHSYSPLSKGLFHQVIMQSGTALNFWAAQPLPSQPTAVLSEATGCISPSNWNSGNYDGLRNCLQKLPWAQLLKLAAKEEVWLPVVDGAGGFLPVPPAQLPRPSNIPVLMGSNHDEWGWVLLSLLNKKLSISNITEEYFKGQLASIINRNIFPDTYTLIGLREIGYYSYASPLMGSSQTKWLTASVQLQSEYNIQAGVAAEADSLCRNGNPVYLYSFDFVSPNLWGSSPYTGVMHFFDMLYLFPGIKDSLGWQFGPADKAISEYFGAYWSNFVLSGCTTTVNSTSNDPMCVKLRRSAAPGERRQTDTLEEDGLRTAFLFEHQQKSRNEEQLSLESEIAVANFNPPTETTPPVSVLYLL